MIWVGILCFLFLCFGRVWFPIRGSCLSLSLLGITYKLSFSFLVLWDLVFCIVSLPYRTVVLSFLVVILLLVSSNKKRCTPTTLNLGPVIPQTRAVTPHFDLMSAFHTLGMLSTSFTWNAFPTVLKEFPHMLNLAAWLLFLHSVVQLIPNHLNWVEVE